MRRHPQHAITNLRRAIDGLPGRTREAMLEGIGLDPVITGAYTDRDGGVCPMLSAHRRGARADFVAFAGAWDRFTGVNGQGICRRATPRELGVLVAQLEESMDVGPPSDLAAAIVEHQALGRVRRGREASDVGLDWLRGGDTAPVVEDAPAPRVRAHAVLA